MISSSYKYLMIAQESPHYNLIQLFGGEIIFEVFHPMWSAAGGRRNVRSCRMQLWTVQISDVPWKWRW